jgi:murein DD-endopeptidase MepM/ murein hydrolase activator NlpD/LysM repeat protein
MIFPVTLQKKLLLFVLAFLLAACLPQGVGEAIPATPTVTPPAGPTATPLPTRPKYNPGELVDYVAQTGDTLPALAARFNTTGEEILVANPQVPADVTTMPPGMPMKIPIYYLPFWGTPFRILPDSGYVNGPSAIGFDTTAFVSSHPGWLKDYRAYVVSANHSGAEIVDIVATNYSISPRLLLALLEYQTGALSQPVQPSGNYPLGEVDYNYNGLYMQLIWAANMLNYGYYGWRTGQLTELDRLDGTVERPDPWQTAATVAFQYYFSLHSSTEQYAIAIGPDGLARVYRELFGDPWQADQPHIPVSLQQPAFSFPFSDGETWSLTGGPHGGWGIAKLWPWAAIDFGPPDVKGCASTARPAVAVADGVVVRSETGVVVLDLDGDGDERTGWDILYLHVATAGRASVGRTLKRGDPVGYPSCEGGTATGTHVHVARKYNGEWIPADGALAFDLEGWIVHNGDAAYQGTLIRGNQTVTACACSDAPSQVQAGK